MAISGSGNIPAGKSGTTIKIPIVDDDIEEQKESFQVSVTSSLGGESAVTIFIADNDTKTNPRLGDRIQGQ